MTEKARLSSARRSTGSGGPREWYRDAIIYQLHVRAFCDSNNDGIGDFVGLKNKLDYIVDLGATAIWLLPFFESPLKDDGYEVSNYYGINPAYGTLDEFRDFVEAAHARGIRVIVELVINHTSDQHPWFQRARGAPAGSAERDFYVWSTTGKEFSEARVIFLDSEMSNWTWDQEARAYFWHRFFAHQPDLNFDNPFVIREVEKILDFWMDLGVDGFRLDAVPYLIEREGTTGENLRETHNVLKLIRAAVERRDPDCLLLAEANQLPQDALPYFGAGDECHMAFHFPLMPRLFMALSQEDRRPVVDILKRTLELPKGCQWALFLRNHDELTLEMVSEPERKHLWQVYATHRRLRINLGIRRRLAPLLGGDRRRIELMNSLLLSLPGTPVIYYGDEIGMGDNPFLGDRDGVRTPMQWSADRNAGFSRTDEVAMYLPPVKSAQYGYESVNVEMQRALRSSLLNWMRWVIRVRNAHSAFGRGEIRFLHPDNTRVLVYVRSFGEEIVLCAVNLAETSQAVLLDLSQYEGRTPVSLFGGGLFPVIKKTAYPLTFSGHSFYWLALLSPTQARQRYGNPDEKADQPELPAPDENVRLRERG